MRKEKRISLLLFFMAAFILLHGCSVHKAATGPRAKDLSVLNTGTDRFVVLAELGQPLVSEKDDNGNKVDLFKFIQGQHSAARAGKGIVYGVLAVGTLGISEIVTNPVEGAIGDGAEMQLKVVYDKDNKINVVTVLKDDRWIPVQEVKKEN